MCRGVRGCGGREICRGRVSEITNLDIVGLEMNVGGWGKALGPRKGVKL